MAIGGNIVLHDSKIALNPMAYIKKDIKNNNIIYINYLYLDSALFAILYISHLYDVFIVDERRSRGAISNNPLTMET